VAVVGDVRCDEDEDDVDVEIWDEDRSLVVVEIEDARCVDVREDHKLITSSGSCPSHVSNTLRVDEIDSGVLILRNASVSVTMIDGGSCEMSNSGKDDDCSSTDNEETCCKQTTRM
jgi:hypothetical protein